MHVPGVHALVKRLAAGGSETWILAFNMTEGLHGTAREGQVPALLEAYRVPSTFSDAATMELCLDKGRTKMVLQYYLVPTAPLVVLHLDDEEELTPEKIQKTIDHYQHAKKSLKISEVCKTTC
ncbi:hypothetical protein BDV30DRAFT_235405 [Aspergillus minisclerotigenes]|uniref:Uncharacterized protein n=1 Tax=Aspergillus minisclerotigenes TaxID=656917 RepID=A0A5N6JFY8_9EURO|nr:hypothetical protein BDV30DRAFT_235405 [Aspergillus minisclerotigenes]